ncbi:MAG: hypothetical protein Q8927_03725 [Bacteroidota bacterium]|nr:hypothetical protein [Bacteroidota bacterium]MDP4215286.1 hypothetical protein [Bacteroidota bacterium]MDP4254288.1 hypothetical protein [Bacteroidota bacterium]MDP4259225.1 hypothetical protein [Bacteroidota bacterium]
MSGFRLRINGLESVPHAFAIQRALANETAFEVQYFFKGQGNYIVVQPMLVSNVIVFLVHFPAGEESSMALVYNTRDEWSDIGKESTGLTEAIGQAIENYYYHSYLPGSSMQKENYYLT